MLIIGCLLIFSAIFYIWLFGSAATQPELQYKEENDAVQEWIRSERQTGKADHKAA